jgi:hypothetical protein
LVPVATTDRVKLPPGATSVSAAGWVVMTGATMVAPLLEELLELLDDELLELDDELEELELDEELLLDEDEDELELEELLDEELLSPPPHAVSNRQSKRGKQIQILVSRVVGIGIIVWSSL